MRKYGFMIVFLGLLIAGGFMTAISGAGGIGEFLPILQQSGDSAAATEMIEPWQAEQLFLMIGFILFNIIGIGATLAGIFWLLNRGTKLSQAQEEAEENS